METSTATDTIDISTAAAEEGRPLEVPLTLAAPAQQLRVRLPAGEAGRAEARFADGRNWAAKHHWREDDGVVVYQFDEALPAGPVRLVVPFAPFAPAAGA